MIRRAAMAAVLLLGAAACGRQGDLVRPDPDPGARPAPRAGEGRAPGQDSGTSQTETAPVPPPATASGAVPTISSAPIESTNDPVGRPPATTSGGPR